MLPEVPAASRMILADRSNYLTRPPIFPGYDLIVIHCTDGHPAALGVAQMWQQPGASGKHTSAHFVIGQDGEAIQCVPLAFATAVVVLEGFNEPVDGVDYLAGLPA